MANERTIDFLRPLLGQSSAEVEIAADEGAGGSDDSSRASAGRALDEGRVMPNVNHAATEKTDFSYRAGSFCDRR